MKTKNMIIAALMLALPIAAMAQTNEQKNEARRQYYNNYGHWTIGLNGGLSAMFGDFSTFSDEKFYPAPIGSVSVGYQMNPTVGFTLEGYYSHNQLGALSSNKDEYLNTNGFKADGPTDPLTGDQFLKYGELYSKVTLWQGRLGLDLNLSNMFGGNRGERMRKVTLLFSPSYYFQYYRPRVYRKSDDARYTSRNLFYQVNNGVGAELALRFRTGRIVDLQLKGGGVYGFNKKFDGIAGDNTKNILAYVQAGIIFKLNGKTKRDNILYAATPAYVPEMNLNGHCGKSCNVMHDTIYVDRIVEKEVVREVIKRVATLPSIGFRRGHADIDQTKYALQLETIVRFLKDNPDMEVEITGWADHTGGEAINAALTQQRAENLRDYLAEQGISLDRIKSVEGKGKDLSLSGRDALSVKARRADVVGQEK